MGPADFRIGHIRPPVRSSKGQSGALQVIDHSVSGSMTAQPPGLRSSVLRVAAHGQQFVYSTASSDRAGEDKRT